MSTPAAPITTQPEALSRGVTSGIGPDISPAQIVSGIPILAELRHCFGVYTSSQAQRGFRGAAMPTWDGDLSVGIASPRSLRTGHCLVVQVTAGD